MTALYCAALLAQVLCATLCHRPPLPREVEQYDAYQRQRLYVTPGLTCYWQIQPHRNDLTFDEWMELDIKYMKERSFLVDWKIIFQTVRVVLFGQGV